MYITYTSRNEEADETKEIQKILSERKGICQDYALLFKALVKEAGMDAYVIDGYNRRDGALLPDPHEWCAAKVSGKWYMFDPTWGAGICGKLPVHSFPESSFLQAVTGYITENTHAFRSDVPVPRTSTEL